MTSGMPPSLQPHQIEQIVRDRLAGLQYKTIARRVGCTRDQAIHYWRISTAYRPQAKRAASAKRREARKAASLLAVQREARKAIARQESERSGIAYRASVVLRQEISLAVLEATHARPFKPGPLEWSA